MAGMSPSAKTFTPMQGRSLAYIHLYTPASPASQRKPTCSNIFASHPLPIHQMVLTLERAGFIRQQLGVARSIEVLVDPKLLPDLV
jgi:hypothetical protein